MKMIWASDISLADAERVVKAHHDEENAKKAIELRKFVGRFFKRRSESISGGGGWLYATASEVRSGNWPRVYGLTFENNKSHGYGAGMVVRPNSEVGIDSGGADQGAWIEIESEEFWGAAKLLRAELVALLTPPTS